MRTSISWLCAPAVGFSDRLSWNGDGQRAGSLGGTFMSASKPTFVFVHGFWHDQRSWARVAPALEALGYQTRILDLPGAGARAKMPNSFYSRPLDAAAFATEPSPNAGVTQEERTRAVVDVVKNAGGPVVLVGHSMGGATISDVAEAAPERLAAVVYVTAFLLTPGTPSIAVIQHATMASALVPSLFRADPAVVGALRIDTASDDAAYRATLKSAFFGDVSDADFANFAPTLHCDEPLSAVLRPSAVTAARFGAIPRHYIRCTEDQAITLEGQDFMIGAMDQAIGNKTIQHTLQSSHSPFLSRAAELTTSLATIAG
jgi:pimeloyl-ACP methyl ester carboxylesterase